MLEELLIFTRGLILWTCKELGNALRGSPIDALIRSCLLEERSGDSSYNYDAPGAAYTLKWTSHNELDLVFVAVYQRILHLLYVDDLLAMVKKEFLEVYDPKRTVYNDFDDKFRQLRKEAEARAEEMKKSNQVGKPVNNSTLGKKHGKVQQTCLEGGNKKNVAVTQEMMAGTAKNQKVISQKMALLIVIVMEMGKWLQRGTVNGKENESSNTGAFDVNKLKKLGGKGAKTTDAVIKKVPKVESKKKITKKNRVWDEAPPKSKLDFTDSVSESGDENIVVVATNKGESMMDKEEIISSDGDSEEDEDMETDRKVDTKKGLFSSMFQR